MCRSVPSEFDSISTGLFSGPSTSTWIGQPFDWIVGIVSPQMRADALWPLLSPGGEASQDAPRHAWTADFGRVVRRGGGVRPHNGWPVSYTHLTLPTSDLV